MKKYTVFSSISLLLVMVSFWLVQPAPVFALEAGKCYVRDGTSQNVVNESPCPSGFTPDPATCYLIPVSSSGVGSPFAASCESLYLPGTEPAGASAGSQTRLQVDCKPAEGEELSRENCGIIDYIFIFTNFLSAIVGIVAVLMIVYRGIQYSTARDNPQVVQQARLQILQVVIALLVYIFTYAFLQWVVPGGVF